MQAVPMSAWRCTLPRGVAASAIRISRHAIRAARTAHAALTDRLVAWMADSREPLRYPLPEFTAADAGMVLAAVLAMLDAGPRFTRIILQPPPGWDAPTHAFQYASAAAAAEILAAALVGRLVAALLSIAALRMVAGYLPRTMRSVLRLRLAVSAEVSDWSPWIAACTEAMFGAAAAVGGYGLAPLDRRQILLSANVRDVETMLLEADSPGPWLEDVTLVSDVPLGDAAPALVRRLSDGRSVMVWTCRGTGHSVLSAGYDVHGLPEWTYSHRTGTVDRSREALFEVPTAVQALLALAASVDTGFRGAAADAAVADRRPVSCPAVPILEAPRDLCAAHRRVPAAMPGPCPYPAGSGLAARGAA